jgi:hypothetical protein
MWWLPQISNTHIQESRRFESMYTLQGKTQSTWRIRFPRQSMYDRYTLSTGSSRTWQPFTSRRQSWAGPLLPRKRAPDTIYITPADRSAGLYPVSLPSQLMKQWGQSQPFVDGRLLTLSGPYHRHEIGTFNTCSWGPTHRSLTDTGGGYNLEGASFVHTTLRSSQPMVSTFHLRAPPGLQFIQNLSTKLEFEFKGTYGRHVVFWPLGHLL